MAISSRALFDFEAENAVFEAGDAAGYMALQLERLEQVAGPGVALPLIQKLLAFNTEAAHRVEVVIVSRNDPVSGLRVFHSAVASGLRLERGVFTQGREPYRYLRPLRANLFLSANDADVRAALLDGFPAAHVYPDSMHAANAHPAEVRIAFDGDAVLFSDEAERVFQRDGLALFHQHEQAHSRVPLSAGPFKSFLEALHRLQQADAPMRLRTALVTARSAPAHERAIRTLMSWNIHVDEALFLGGLDKGPFLAEFEPDFFFDDQTGHCRSGAQVGPTGQVLAGVVNEA
ncbi:5'-nucleotidase [Chitiniphilus purpureus]|uniref:5'-nucleotidase n=1 Tax=Chitiniphilus purpureus TaxID=2981137 RepID=A0ABY6DMU9_9NEIS|nr:5'-nucleotidase [Chitiniphilus sp. CD1]UXY15699.1 5'-nucleotidase [Chitiniphilus sp. CD1]